MAIETQARHASAGGLDRMPPVVLGVVLFVCSEAIFFSALFAAWFTARARSTQWPPKGIHIDPTFGALASAVLLISSLMVYAARDAIRSGDHKGMQLLVSGAIVLGLAALGLQATDMARLSFTVSTNGFGTVFWTTSVIDSAHVLGAIVFGFLVLDRAWFGVIRRGNHEIVAAFSVFWHFVVGLSIFTFIVLEVAS